MIFPPPYLLCSKGGRDSKGLDSALSNDLSPQLRTTAFKPLQPILFYVVLRRVVDIQQCLINEQQDLITETQRHRIETLRKAGSPTSLPWCLAAETQIRAWSPYRCEEQHLLTQRKTRHVFAD